MATTDKAVPAIPFAVASQYSTRQSFQTPTVTLAASASTQVTPIQVPAVGYLDGLLLHVTLAGTGGTTPAFTADAPFNVLQSINFRNAAGVNLIAPVNGYDLYLMNKYGGQTFTGAAADPKFNVFTGVSGDEPNADFYLWLPLGIDKSDAYATIPALASNANYQVEMTLSGVDTIMSGAPSVDASIDALAVYYDLPAATDAAGRAQATMPESNAVSVWQRESPTISPGTQLVQSFNVGNVIRNHILTIRNSSGARIDTNGAPGLLELYLDNQPRFAFQNNDHEYFMTRWFGLDSATKDTPRGLDTGVYVIPYHALTGGLAGDPANTRAQLLPTLSATLLQFRAQDFGSAVSRLEILTEAISTTDAAYLYGK